MKLTIKGTPEEIAKMLRAISSSKEQEEKFICDPFVIHSSILEEANRIPFMYIIVPCLGILAIFLGLILSEPLYPAIASVFISMMALFLRID